MGFYNSLSHKGRDPIIGKVVAIVKGENR